MAGNEGPLFFDHFVEGQRPVNFGWQGLIAEEASLGFSVNCLHFGLGLHQLGNVGVKDVNRRKNAQGTKGLPVLERKIRTTVI